LKNDLRKDFKFFTTIKKRIIENLSSRQVSEHPSEAKQSWSEANVQY